MLLWSPTPAAPCCCEPLAAAVNASVSCRPAPCFLRAVSRTLARASALAVSASVEGEVDERGDHGRSEEKDKNPEEDPAQDHVLAGELPVGVDHPASGSSAIA